MGSVRAELTWRAVLDAVELAGGGPLSILDIGGGTGGDAVRLAVAGHRVRVVDPSPDALASLARRASEADVADRLAGVLGDTGDLADHVGDDPVDLVLCHGLLEHVDEPAEALAAATAALRPGGWLSLVVPNRLGAVVHRAVAGDFAAAAHLLATPAAAWDLRADGPRRFSPEEAAALVRDAGLTVRRTTGLRVFADLVPSAVVDAEPGARAALYDLERTVSTDPELSVISAGLQLVACLESR